MLEKDMDWESELYRFFELIGFEIILKGVFVMLIEGGFLVIYNVYDCRYDFYYCL